jgi:hypothetical protein
MRLTDYSESSRPSTSRGTSYLAELGAYRPVLHRCVALRICEELLDPLVC